MNFDQAIESLKSDNSLPKPQATRQRLFDDVVSFYEKLKVYTPAPIKKRHPLVKYKPHMVSLTGFLSLLATMFFIPANSALSNIIGIASIAVCFFGFMFALEQGFAEHLKRPPEKDEKQRIWSRILLCHHLSKTQQEKDLFQTIISSLHQKKHDLETWNDLFPVLKKWEVCATEEKEKEELSQEIVVCEPQTLQMKVSEKFHL